MSISQTTPEETAAGQLFCPQCKAALPQRATFCSSCGERLERKKQISVSDEEDINTRYRITTLVRRRPYVNLYFALDNRQPLPVGQSRMVAIRDIEIASLKKETKAEVIALVQREYDQLRRWHLPHLLTSMDLRVFQGHIFLVLGMPPGSQEPGTGSARSSSRLYTLQDFLQSGQGLPREARTLEWVRNLCQVLESLHRQQIVLGDLDPYTVILNKNSATAEPRLMVSWLPMGLQKLLPDRVTGAPQVSYFCAPEAVQGEAEVRSDIYSLGALFYLLLTGTPPDESTLRTRRRLRSPREINSRLSQQVDDCVMQALAMDPEDRFASATEMLAALADPHFRLVLRKNLEPAAAQDLPAGEAETVRIVPLSQKDVVRWRAAREENEDGEQTITLSAQRVPVLEAQPPKLTPIPPSAVDAPTKGEKPAREKIKQLPITPPPETEAADQVALLKPKKAGRTQKASSISSNKERLAWKDRITGILPAARPEKTKKEEGTADASRKRVGKSRVVPPLPKTEGEASLLKQLQRLILGQQQHAVEAAAIIETPMRIRPDQAYNLRMHVMGRDEPSVPPGSKKDVQPAGLSALIHGTPIQVEVRSVLQQGYTYVLQQATVTIPANGYAAEITIPMQPQPGGASGRRDRLYFFFLDGKRNPLYEKPFIIEVFVSPLVQFGREGHQVLTIPL